MTTGSATMARSLSEPSRHPDTASYGSVLVLSHESEPGTVRTDVRAVLGGPHWSRPGPGLRDRGLIDEDADAWLISQDQPPVGDLLVEAESERTSQVLDLAGQVVRHRS